MRNVNHETRQCTQTSRTCFTGSICRYLKEHLYAGNTNHAAHHYDAFRLNTPHSTRVHEQGRIRACNFARGPTFGWTYITTHACLLSPSLRVIDNSVASGASCVYLPSLSLSCANLFSLSASFDSSTGHFMVPSYNEARGNRYRYCLPPCYQMFSSSLSWYGLLLCLR